VSGPPETSKGEGAPRRARGGSRGDGQRGPAMSRWAALSAVMLLAACCGGAAARRPAPRPQAKPFTGLVPFYKEDASDSPELLNPFVSLEFLYLLPRDVCPRVASGQSASSSVQCEYDWSALHAKLDKVASRGHQAVIRLADLVNGAGRWELALPAWVKAENGGLVQSTTRQYNGQTVTYARWDAAEAALDGANAEEEFWTGFLAAVGAQLNADHRVAYVQGIAGHWSEGHVWRDGLSDAHSDIGVIFPCAEQYQAVIAAMQAALPDLRWQLGISSGDAFYWYSRAQATDAGRMAQVAADNHFGTFEDSFLSSVKEDTDWNSQLLSVLGEERWKKHPRGGEVAFNGNSQADAAKNPARFIAAVRARHQTFAFATPAIITKQIASVAPVMGYQFKLATKFSARARRLTVTVTNLGVAPIYYDTFVSIDGVLQQGAGQNLRDLLPGKELVLVLATGSRRTKPHVDLRCERAPLGTVPHVRG
jgi:hypothetical protein